MGKRDKLARLLYRTGGTRLLDLYWGANRLTVLGYHRICDPHAPDFAGFEPNVSATPAMFARQMDYVQQHFNVISLDELHAFVTEETALPPRPLLITFDDGYLDNFTNAYPILRERNMPAVFFLVSRWMGTAYHPWWDACGDLFRLTHKTRVELPVIGTHDLSTPQARIMARDTLMLKLKGIPEDEKQRHMDALATALAVTLPEPEKPLFISAEQARELVANGIACQMHTATHPILTRISSDTARAELAESKTTLEHEIGQPVTALAYPNGGFDDYDATVMQHLRDLGVPLAFTLEYGPLWLRHLPARALEIPRVFLLYRDSFELFATKVMGASVLLERPRFHGQ